MEGCDLTLPVDAAYEVTSTPTIVEEVGNELGALVALKPREAAIAAPQDTHQPAQDNRTLAVQHNMHETNMQNVQNVHHVHYTAPNTAFFLASVQHSSGSIDA